MAFTLRPAVKDDFIDRKELVNEMVYTLSNPQIAMGFALIGPRRMGKTSILKEVARRLNNKKEVVAIYISIWELVENTVIEFSKEFTNATFDAFKSRFAMKHKLRELVKAPAKKVYEVLKTLDIHIRFMDEIEVEIGRREKQVDTGSLIRNLFCLSEDLSERFGVRTVLIIDEFPSIIDLKNGRKIGEGIVKKIRTINEELQRTVLCVSGSIRKTMENALLLPSSPFYRQFIVKKVGPFDKTSVASLLTSNISKPISDEAFEEVYNLTQGIPFYIQFIGRELGRSPEPFFDKGSICNAFYGMLKEEGDIIFAQEFCTLSDKERAILKSMAVSNISRLSQIARRLTESSNVISKYLEYLIYKGIIEKRTRGNYEIVDPVFKTWLGIKFR